MYPYYQCWNESWNAWLYSVFYLLKKTVVIFNPMFKTWPQVEDTLCSACSTLQMLTFFFWYDTTAQSSECFLPGSRGPLVVAKRHVTGPRDRTLQAAREERLAVTGRVTWYSIIRRHDNPGSNAVDSAVTLSTRSWREAAANASASAETSFSFLFYPLQHQRLPCEVKHFTQAVE